MRFHCQTLAKHQRRGRGSNSEFLNTNEADCLRHTVFSRFLLHGQQHKKELVYHLSNSLPFLWVFYLAVVFPCRRPILSSESARLLTEAAGHILAKRAPIHRLSKEWQKGINRPKGQITGSNVMSTVKWSPTVTRLLLQREEFTCSSVPPS